MPSRFKTVPSLVSALTGTGAGTDCANNRAPAQSGVSPKPAPSMM